MPLHHYLPASFLARFSADSKTNPARERFLIVGDKKTKKSFKAHASKVGCVKNLYTLTDKSTDPDMIDRTWAEYERKLPAAIESLIQRKIDTENWIRVLVPFVACMLVRGPDFKEKFDLRFTSIRSETLTELLSDDNANKARLIDLQRLLGFVVTAKWLVLSTKGEEKLITNDLGYSPFINPVSGEPGIAIPLDKNIILVIIPSLEDHPILLEEANKWVPIIKYSNLLDLTQADNNYINKVLAQTANRFIFGSDEKIIGEYINEIASSTVSLESTAFGFPDGKFARAHEFTWHRLVSAINKPPSDKKGWDFSLDWETVTSGWYSIPFLPLNLVEFPPALKRVKNTIQTRFYDPEIYYDISKILELENGGKYSDAIKLATIALNTSKLTSILRARILAIRGDILAKIGKTHQAIKDFEDAIALDRSNADLHINFGYMLLKAGNAPKAYKILSKAIKLNPRHGVAYSNRSIAQWSIGRHKDAINDSTIAIKLLPDGIEKGSAFLNRGNILRDFGLEMQAKEDFIQAETLFKKYSTKSS